MLAEVRAAAWAAIIAGNQALLPAVQVAGRPLTRSGTGEPVTVIRVDATIIEAAGDQGSVGGRALQTRDRLASVDARGAATPVTIWP